MAFADRTVGNGEVDRALEEALEAGKLESSGTTGDCRAVQLLLCHLAG